VYYHSWGLESFSLILNAYSSVSQVIRTPSINTNFTDNGAKTSYAPTDPIPIDVAGIDLATLENHHTNYLNVVDITTTEPNFGNTVDAKPEPKGEKPVVTVVTDPGSVSSDTFWSTFVEEYWSVDTTMSNRIAGVAQAAGGAAEALLGASMVGAGLAGIPATAGTSVLVTVSGVAVTLHGIDNIQTGIHQAISGEPVQTMTSYLIENVTGSRVAGEVADFAIGFVNPIAAGRTLSATKSIAGDISGVKNVGTKLKDTPSVKMGGCFLAGTLVSRYRSDTVDQRELTGIENIKSGDLVWACNSRIGKWEPKLVIGTSTHLYEGNIVKLIVNGEAIEATDTHPVWVVIGNDLGSRPKCTNLTNSDSELTPQGRWVNARDVKIGDTVLSRTQRAMSVSNVESRFEIVQVYNFIVDDLHSYAVGIDEILVHNQSMTPLEGFENLADAIGDINGYAKIIGTAKAKSTDYKLDGFTKIFYVLDSNGMQHTVAFNPKTKIYRVSHDSSGW
jgi:hypothetical protein